LRLAISAIVAASDHYERDKLFHIHKRPGKARKALERDMLFTMRKAAIFISALVFGAFGLCAQDDLAQYQTWMKTAAGANGAIRGAVTAGDSATVSAKAKDMAEAFDQIAAYWKAKGKDDAMNFAVSARDAAKTASAASSIDDQKAALAKVGPTCMGCHAIYRDGSKFKAI
jgi:hypothetical protein